ncbi:hypothetical protein BDQ17DRAFT_1244018 [Cyathus striatus]|nr:hypothetical protein BDQ17DRAFT_1244018 [Cyathus striatus]
MHLLTAGYQVGCQTKITPEGDQTPRVCPRCHNAAVIRAKSREWFEFFFIPVIPMSSKHIWICSICNWTLPVQAGWEPQPVASMVAPGGYRGGWQQAGYGGWGQGEQRNEGH